MPGTRSERRDRHVGLCRFPLYSRLLGASSAPHTQEQKFIPSLPDMNDFSSFSSARRKDGLGGIKHPATIKDALSAAMPPRFGLSGRNMEKNIAHPSSGFPIPTRATRENGARRLSPRLFLRQAATPDVRMHLSSSLREDSRLRPLSERMPSYEQTHAPFPAEKGAPLLNPSFLLPPNCLSDREGKHSLVQKQPVDIKEHGAACPAGGKPSFLRLEQKEVLSHLKARHFYGNTMKVTLHFFEKTGKNRVTNKDVHMARTKLTKWCAKRSENGSGLAKMCIPLPAVTVSVPIIANDINMLSKIGTNGQD